MRKALLFTLILAAMAPMARATEFAGAELVIPIVGRTAGAAGSQWRTDVYVTNLARPGLAAEPVYLVLSGHGSPDQVTTVSIEPFATVTYRDLLSTAFGRQTGSGMLRIVALSPTAKLTARARIYNTASAAGQYGQTVHAMPVGSLSMDAMLPGLSGLGVNRTNVGLANPASAPVGAWISLYEKSGEFLGAYSVEVPARGLYLMNDVFAHFQAGPLDDAMIRVRSTGGLYVYGSIVRSDTGDADFVTATSTEVAPSDAIVMPTCNTPAPLRLAPIPAKGWIVIFHSKTDAAAVTAQLAARYGFTPLHIYEHALQAFSAELTQAQIAALRCEPAVQAIEQNAIVPIP
ncbi:MAG: protease inhibitor I9 family protein [Thermoanaerobaculia bacterium]